MIHETAARGFRGEVYERGRPGYPPEAAEALGLEPGSRAVDLGCGTGKLTRLLVGTKARVIGVEPLHEMRVTFREVLPEVPVLGAAAEALPFADRSLDAVVCAQAFHWFRHDVAIPELRRVLRPGGLLGLVWNRRDASVRWVAEMWAVVEEHRRGTPGYATEVWRRALEASEDFGPLSEEVFDYVHRVTPEALADRLASISFIAILGPRERKRVAWNALQVARSSPEAWEGDLIAMPYRTHVYRALREG